MQIEHIHFILFIPITQREDGKKTFQIILIVVEWRVIDETIIREFDELKWKKWKLNERIKMPNLR